MRARFHTGQQQDLSKRRFIEFAKKAVSGKISPNGMELQKILANCLAVLSKKQSLKDFFADVEMQVDEQQESKIEQPKAEDSMDVD